VNQLFSLAHSQNTWVAVLQNCARVVDFFLAVFCCCRLAKVGEICYISNFCNLQGFCKRSRTGLLWIPLLPVFFLRRKLNGWLHWAPVQDKGWVPKCKNTL